MVGSMGLVRFRPLANRTRQLRLMTSSRESWSPDVTTGMSNSPRTGILFLPIFSTCSGDVVISQP